MKSQKSKVKSQKFLKSILFSFFIALFRFGGLVFIFYFLIFNFSLVSAQTTLPLLVYPARQFLELEPGEKTSIAVNFVNQAKEPVSGLVKVVDFIVRDNQGTPELIEKHFCGSRKICGCLLV
jgi:hypothetical protein